MKIGDKIRGFKFDREDFIFVYVDQMDDYINMVGVIDSIDEKYNEVYVKFKKPNFQGFSYPLDEAEQYLVYKTPKNVDIFPIY